MDVTDRFLIALAMLGGAVCAVGGTMYLYLSIGAIPFPISAVGFSALLAGITVATRRLTGESWHGALPVIAFLVVVVAFLLGGPGQSVMYMDWRLPLLLVCGIGLPIAAGMLVRAD